MKELQRLLLSDMPLWISPSGYQQLLATAIGDGDIMVGDAAKSSEAAGAGGGVHGHDGVAIHTVHGIITASSPWYFSSRQLQADLLAAEGDPSVCAHLLHVNSPGGEAWYLDRLSETLSQCQKPIVCLYEQCCSAAYHIASHASRLYATTQFDFVGCIGTMVSYRDFEPLLEKLGIAKVEAKASGSDLKNKTFEDLRQGDPKSYTEAFLNPLNETFIATVLKNRPQLAQLEKDHPALRGETYFTKAAIDIGLVDGQRTLAEALSEAAALGRQWKKDRDTARQLYDL